MDKKNQHFVWKYYLRPWARSEKIFFLRKEKIIESNLKNVAVMNYFYRLKELNEKEIDMIKRLFVNNVPDYYGQIHNNLLSIFKLVFQIKEKVNLDSSKIDLIINNLEDDLHTSIENSAKKYLDLLMNKNIDFYAEEEGNIEFNIYI